MTTYMHCAYCGCRPEIDIVAPASEINRYCWTLKCPTCAEREAIAKTKRESHAHLLAEFTKAALASPCLAVAPEAGDVPSYAVGLARTTLDEYLKSLREEENTDTLESLLFEAVKLEENRGQGYGYDTEHVRGNWLLRARKALNIGGKR